MGAESAALYMGKALGSLYAVGNAVNLATTGKPMWDNPEGAKYKVALPGGMYFDLLGHFKEPIKAAGVHSLYNTFRGKEFPGHSFEAWLPHKMSAIGSALLNQYKGEDWRGRSFSTWQDMLHGQFHGGYQGTKNIFATAPGRIMDLAARFIPIPGAALLQEGFTSISGETPPVYAAVTVAASLLGLDVRPSYQTIKFMTDYLAAGPQRRATLMRETDPATVDMIKDPRIWQLYGQMVDFQGLERERLRDENKERREAEAERDLGSSLLR